MCRLGHDLAKTMLTADSFQLAAFSRVSVGKPQPGRIVHVDITHYDAAYSMPRIHTEFGVKTEYRLRLAKIGAPVPET